MDAIVPAAGEGTRLRPLTGEMPKGLVTVRDRPILAHCFDTLLELGADRLVVVIGYEGHQIVERFGDRYQGIPVTYVEQPEPEGLAQAVGLGGSHVTGDAMILFGDSVFGAPPTDVVDRFRNESVEVAIAIEEVQCQEASAHTVCEMDEKGTVTGLTEKPETPPSPYIMAGFVVGTAKLVTATHQITPSRRGEYELADAIGYLIDSGHRIVGVPITGDRVNVNTADDVDAARRLLENARPRR